jgi:transposase-like protein
LLASVRNGAVASAVEDRAGGPLAPALCLSDRDVDELLAERGVDIDHVTVDRWVVGFTPLLARRPGPGGARSTV